jgi:hypothetical protein
MLTRIGLWIEEALPAWFTQTAALFVIIFCATLLLMGL